jgi:UDP-2,3-diacylglucosamine pyrophosphatase LpxH
VSAWRCKYCTAQNEGALGVCDCGTVRGAQAPGTIPEIRPPLGARIRERISPPPPTMEDRLRERLGEPAYRTEPIQTPETDRLEPISRLEPILVVSDAHIPYHSPIWWDLLLQVGRDIRPKTVVIIGDFADFYAVSDHDKSPDRANAFDQELDVVDGCLDQLDALGAGDKLYIEGNHEDRLRRYLMKNPALHGVVNTERLLHLKERGWQFVPYKHHASRGAVHFTHDVGTAGRNAVFKALELYQHSVITGHTHRFAYIVEGSATGECKLSAMFGWGGDVEQVEYMNLAKARKDWALGFGVGYHDPSSGFIYFVPVPVVHGTCCVNGRLYRATAQKPGSDSPRSAPRSARQSAA